LGKARCDVDIGVVILGGDRGDMSVRSSGSDRPRIQSGQERMRAIERSVWRFVEPGGIVADPGTALVYRVFDGGVGGWMNVWNDGENG